MGLLTDPHTGRGRIVRVICRFHVPICIFFYFGAIIWLALLPYSNVSTSVHFSENALLPGLVKTEFSQETVAKDFYDELLQEMKKYKDSIPYPWLLAKFRQIGLDTYTHNFTLNYPLGKAQHYTGNNVYGILRAARAASTESVVLSVPFRAPNSVHPSTAPSIAIMLAFAKYANREKYWAKDIIFLVTEHEQLGIQAWLKAYHSKSYGNDEALNYGELRGRAGQIQAAINLEMNDLKIAVMDVKVEGLNGQLPNLDLFTLVNKMCINEGLHVTFKNRAALHPQSSDYRHWKHSLITMLSMMFTQSTGIPTGNHGLYLPFGIQAVTMNGFIKPNSRGNQIGFFSMGKILEGIFRSLNNLLERFHQSYFFYLLPSNDRFISIIWYIPVLGFLVGALFVRSLYQWYNVWFSPFSENQEKCETYRILNLYLLSHTIGVLMMHAPTYMTQIGAYYGLTTDYAIYYGFGIISVLLLIIPFLFRLQHERSMIVLHMFILWELATSILAIGMINFSLGALIALFITPFALIISPTCRKIKARLQYLFWFLVHPFIAVNIIVLIYTAFMFSTSNIKEVFKMGISAGRSAMVYGIVDSYIYGNWVFNIGCIVFLPVWLCMYCIVVSSPFNKKEDKKEKEE